MDRDLADLLAFAVDTQDAFAGGQADVVDVEADGFGDAGAGVERDERDRLVAGGRPVLHLAQELDRGTVTERAGRGLGQFGPGGVGGSEATAGVEVIDGGQGVVDGGGLAFGHGEQVGAVVARGAVSRPLLGERVAAGVGGGEPDQELTDFGGVGAPGRVGHRSVGEGGEVVVEHRGVRRWDGDCRPTLPSWRLLVL